MGRYFTSWRGFFIEAIVVFLGVTASFFLNNWAHKQAEHRLEQRYLHNFQKEITANQQLLDSIINNEQQWIRKSKDITNWDATTLHNDSAILLLINHMGRWDKISLSSTTYEDMVNSGRLQLIRNDLVRRAIIEYYTSMQEMPEIDYIMREYFMNRILPRVMESVSISERQLTDTSFQHKRSMHNLFMGYYSIRTSRLRLYESIFQWGDSVLSLMRRFEPSAFDDEPANLLESLLQ